MNQEEIMQMIVWLRDYGMGKVPVITKITAMLESLSNELAECQRDIADLNEVRQNDIDEFNRVNTELAALKAEMNKLSEQEPVAMYCGYNPSMGHVFRADAVIEVGTYLYTQPPQQLDLVTEIEAAYDAGYADGYDAGYADGYRTCFEE